MKFIKKLHDFFKKKQNDAMPLLVIKKYADNDVREYKSIEDAIADLEKDPNVPADKIQKIKKSLKNLKNKTIIKIKNGEIIE